MTLRNAKDVLYVSKTVRPKAFSYPRWSTARVLLRQNGVREYPNTRNVKKCVISIVNSIKVFKSAHDEWGV